MSPSVPHLAIFVNWWYHETADRMVQVARNEEWDTITTHIGRRDNKGHIYVGDEFTDEREAIAWISQTSADLGIGIIYVEEP